jgi:hypothetical protein
MRERRKPKRHPYGGRAEPWIGNDRDMNAVPDDVDVAIGEHVTAIRDRFGLDGLLQAQALISTEIAIFEDSYAELASATRLEE